MPAVVVGGGGWQWFYDIHAAPFQSPRSSPGSPTNTHRPREYTSASACLGVPAMPITWNPHDHGVQLPCPLCGQMVEVHVALVGQATPVTRTRGVQTAHRSREPTHVTEAAAVQPPRIHHGTIAPVLIYGGGLYGRAWDGWTPADDLEMMD